MHTVMDSLKEMVDVNTILATRWKPRWGGYRTGFPSVLWVCRRGTDQPFVDEDERSTGSTCSSLRGGSGAGISVKPVAFLVVREDEIRLMSVDGTPLRSLARSAPNWWNKFENCSGTRDMPRETSLGVRWWGHSCS